MKRICWQDNAVDQENYDSFCDSLTKYMKENKNDFF